MFVVMGATGHVGGAVADELLRRGERVTVVTRQEAAADTWRSRGADAVIADATDAEALRAALRRGRRAFVVNPPADPTAGDTDAAEHRSIRAILAALDGSGLEKIVAVSTYGVQPGERIGDLGTLQRLEDGLAGQPIPAAIHRHAYHLTNYDGVVPVARDTGMLPSVLPADLVLPMVAPADLARAAVESLLAPVDEVGVTDVEGPVRATPADIAAILADLLGRPVTVDVTALDALEDAFLGMGFDPAAAESFAGMTRLTASGASLPEHPWRGTITPREHLAAVVAALPPE